VRSFALKAVEVGAQLRDCTIEVRDVALRACLHDAAFHRR
jgi:hypothetical protein